jgi:alkylation response protein AidB-like acyl-CoA dehydrogenase
MYSFEPTEEQNMLTEAINRYATKDLRPAGCEAEEKGEFPKKLLNKGWDLGLTQAIIPEAYGGFGDRSAVTGVLAMEELAYGDLTLAFAISSPNLFTLPILLAGSEPQKHEYLPKIASGAWQPYTAALIEHSFDFDPMALKTIARQTGDQFILNGHKVFVPFVNEAESLIIYATLDDQTQGFIVQKDSPGITISTQQDKLMGLNALPLYQVKLEDVKVPVSNRLGGPSGHEFMSILASMRIGQAAAAVGVARAAFEYSRDYAKEREAFGVKIAQKQAIAFMLAEMGTEIEAVRLITWEAAWKLDTDKDDACVSAYYASVAAIDMALMVTDRAVQILGGHGYIREHPVEMWLRDGRGFGMFTGLVMV